MWCLRQLFPHSAKVKRLTGSKTKKLRCMYNSFSASCPEKTSHKTSCRLYMAPYGQFSSRANFHLTQQKWLVWVVGIFPCMQRGLCSGYNNTYPRRALFTSTFLFVLHIKQDRPSSLAESRILLFAPSVIHYTAKITLWRVTIT